MIFEILKFYLDIARNFEPGRNIEKITFDWGHPISN